MSLLSRILLVLIVAAVAPAAVQAWNAAELRDQRASELHREAGSLAHLANVDVDRIVDGARQLLTAVSLARPVREHDVAACRSFLERLRGGFLQYTVLYVADPATGDNWCSSGRLTSPVSSAGMPAFEIARRTHQFAVGEYLVGQFTGKPSVHFALPFADEKGNVAGVAVVGLSLEWLQHFLVDESWPADVALSVTDRKGTLLARFPNPELVGKPVPQASRSLWETLSSADRGGTLETTGIDGKRRIEGFEPLRTAPGGLYVSAGIDRDARLAAFDQAMWRSLVWAIGSIVVAGIAAYLLAAGFIRRPIRQLLAAASRWREGDYAARCEVDGQGEFGRLSRKLNDMAERLSLREGQLREASESRRRLLAVAGHDLRQPVQTIGMVLDGLAARPASPPDPAAVARGERAFERLRHALDTISDVSRVEAESLVPAPSVFPIAELLLEIEDRWGRDAHRKGITLRVLGCRSLVETDRHMLETVLDNLTNNAIRYTERGRVTVGCRRRGGWLAIHVMDTGIGIPEERLDHIFEEFRQLQPGRGEGMGLGLWIVKKTTERLGLPLSVHSRVGRGTCFRVEVPLALRKVTSKELTGSKPAIREFAR